MPRLAQVHSRSTAGLDTENGFERQELADETRAVLLQVAPKPCIVNRFGSLVPSSGHFRIITFFPLFIQLASCIVYSFHGNRSSRGVTIGGATGAVASGPVGCWSP